MASLASISVSVLARVGSFVKNFGRASKAVGRFARSTKKASAASRLLNANLAKLARFVGVAAIARGFVALAQKTELFNRAMRNSLAIMGDVSEALQRDMAAQAVKTAAVTRFSSRQIAESYFFMASAGMTAAQSIKAVGQIAEFAQAGMFDMAKATSLLADAQSALGLKSKDPIKNLKQLKRVADVLVKANTLANANVEQFAESLTVKAAAAARTVGIELEQVVAVLASFASQGLKASEAGTAFNIVLRELTTKAIRFAPQFEAAGVAVFDAAGQMRNMADIIGDLERLFDGASARLRKWELIQLGFNDKSIVFLQQLIGQAKAIREYESQLQKAADTSQNVADKQLTNLQKAFALLDSTIQNIANSSMPAFIQSLANAIGAADLAFKVFQTIGMENARVVRDGNQFVVSFGSLEEIASLKRITEEADKASASFSTSVGRRARRAERDAERLKKLSDAMRDAVSPSAQKSLDKMAKLIDSLDKSIRQLGFSELDKTLADIDDIIRNAGDALDPSDMLDAIDLAREFARASDELEDSLRRQAKAQEAVQSLFEQTRTPLERYNAEVAALVDLNNQVTLKGNNTFARRMKQLNDELERALGLQSRFRGGSTSQFRQVNFDRIIVSAAGRPLAKSSPQRVHDPQLQLTNQILKKMATTGIPVTLP